jgi:hypothetical protein
VIGDNRRVTKGVSVAAEAKADDTRRLRAETCIFHAMP